MKVGDTYIDSNNSGRRVLIESIDSIDQSVQYKVIDEGRFDDRGQTYYSVLHSFIGYYSPSEATTVKAIMDKYEA